MKTLTPEHRAKIAAAMKDRYFSPEHRARISAAKMGQPSPHIAAFNRARRGQALPPEQRAKMSASALGNRHNQDAPVKGECFYCWKPATTYDHVIPLSRGGLDTESNRVPACASCNSSKRSRTPDEWLAGVSYKRASA